MSDNEFYYYFDCLDGELGEKMLTKADLKTMFFLEDPIEERDIVKIAKNYEADLSRFIKTSSNEFKLDKVLYTCSW